MHQEPDIFKKTDRLLRQLDPGDGGPGDCPDETLLYKLSKNALPPSEAETVELHLAICRQARNNLLRITHEAADNVTPIATSPAVGRSRSVAPAVALALAASIAVFVLLFPSGPQMPTYALEGKGLENGISVTLGANAAPGLRRHLPTSKLLAKLWPAAPNPDFVPFLGVYIEEPSGKLVRVSDEFVTRSEGTGLLKLEGPADEVLDGRRNVVTLHLVLEPEENELVELERLSGTELLKQINHNFYWSFLVIIEDPTQSP